MEVRMLQARSLGKRAGEILSQPPITGRVLASFARVCDLLTDRGEVLALAWDGVPNAPLNILLDNQPGAALPAGTRFVVSTGVLRFVGADGASEICVDFSRARSWDPCPDWSGLAARRDLIIRRSNLIAELLAVEAPSGSLACLAASPVTGAPSRKQQTTLSPHLPLAQRAIEDLQTAYTENDLPTLRAAAARLCGLGPGLTPSGDDWLAGWLIGLRLQGDGARIERIGQLVMEIARERTTVLSQALLACAAAGEVDENWRELLPALIFGTDEEVADSAREVLAHGATSGADTLAGFLQGLHSRDRV